MTLQLMLKKAHDETANKADSRNQKAPRIPRFIAAKESA
jgi:hypothetical protein